MSQYITVILVIWDEARKSIDLSKIKITVKK